MIDSFSYAKPDNIKENKIIEPPVEYKEFVDKKKGDKEEGEPCLNSGECGHLLYCIENKCRKDSGVLPDLQKNVLRDTISMKIGILVNVSQKK